MGHFSVEIWALPGSLLNGHQHPGSGRDIGVRAFVDQGSGPIDLNPLDPPGPFRRTCCMRAGVIGIHPRAVARQDGGARFVEQVDKRKGHVAIVARELRLDSVEDGLMSLGACKGQRKLAQRFQAPLADDPVGLLTDRAKHALDRPLVAQQGAVGKGMIGLLRVARALEDEQKSAVPGRLAL